MVEFKGKKYYTLDEFHARCIEKGEIKFKALLEEAKLKRKSENLVVA